MGDELARSCYECEFYRPNFKLSSEDNKTGKCDRGKVRKFPTYIEHQDCLPIYDKPGKRLSEEEIHERNIRVSREHFQAALERASEHVRSWPDWKRVDIFQNSTQYRQ